jgi:protein TonB
MPKATGLALVIFLLIAGVVLYAAEGLVPPHKPDVIQVTQAQLVTIPAPKPPPPPPPPKVVPPPKPLPVVIPKPPPIPSKIVVATKPPPPVHHVLKHIPKPVPHVAQPTPPPVTQPPPTPMPPAVAVASDDGAAAYGAQMHNVIQANQDMPDALAQLDIKATAIVEVEVAPSGRVVSARIIKSSGVELVDDTALDHARNAPWPPFTANMSSKIHTFRIPIEIDSADAQQ